MKREKFISLAEKRVNNAINSIRVIGNLSNANLYEYTDKDVAKIMQALKSELDNVHAKFKSGGTKGRDTFKL